MANPNSLWYRIGYALERVRHTPPTAQRSLAGLAERAASRPARPPADMAWPSADKLIESGIEAVIGRALDAWKPRHPTSFVRLLQAGAAGAGASLLLELVRPVIRGDRALPTLDRATADRVLTGFAQGLLYAGVVEPRLPGPAALKGAVYGSGEYLTDPLGGLSHLFGAHTPQRRIPLFGRLLDDLDSHDRAFLEHLAFGITLSLLYGSDRARSGISSDLEEAEAGSGTDARA